MSVARSPRPASATSGRRRWPQRLLWCLVTVLLCLCALLGAAWWWTGQSDSLQRTLEYVSRWMPAEQTLQARGVQGTLRHGGSIEWLRWSSPSMQVEVEQARIGWSLPPLLSRSLQIGQIDIAHLRIRNTPAPSDDSPLEPFASLELPLRLDVPLHIAQLTWESSSPITLQDLQAHYRYTGAEHQLALNSLHYADGRYTAQVKLQAAAPMQLQAGLQGQLHVQLPGDASTTRELQAQASIDGQLATADARLQLTAQAHAVTDTPSEPLADISATLAPWSPQVLKQADAQLRRLNLAWFLPDGPHTDLSGSLHAGPKDTGWALQAQLNNPLSGPWDQHALPVHTLEAKAHFDGQSTWTLEQARIQLDPQGRAWLQAQGLWQADTQAFKGQLTVNALNPALIYSSLDSTPLSGSLQAHSDEQARVQFTLDLHAAAAQRPRLLHLGLARATGSWQAPLLQINGLQIEALQASLSSPSIQYKHDTQHITTTLQAKAPGAQASVQLDASLDAGQGKVQLNIQALHTLAQWLEQLPGQHDLLGGLQLQGSASAALQWQGGFNRLLQRLQNPGAPRQSSQLQLQAQLQTPQLHITPAEGQALQLSDLQLQLSGSPEALQTQLHAQLHLADGQHGNVRTAATLGLQAGAQAHALDWYAQLSALQAHWHTHADRTPWKAQLAAPVRIQQRTTGSPTLITRLEAEAGQLSLSPPDDEPEQTAELRWEPVLLQQRAKGGWSLRSKGQLHHLPLMWADTLNPDDPPLATVGLSGDLLLRGHWDIDTTGKNLHAQAVLERASGDIRFTAEDSSASSANVTIIRSTGASQRSAATQQVRSRPVSTGRGVRARIQTMRLQLDAQGKDVRAKLLWSSERAGQIDADISSQIAITPQGISWPDTAPLDGDINISLPNIGVWAFFAPPGWRASGSFIADLELMGTRKAPDWRGHINADHLSIQSLLDGVDLRDGRLRSSFHGTRMDITELSLKGGEGSSTRITGQSGNLTNAPEDGGTLQGSGYIEYDPLAPEDSSGLRMNVQAVANRLQVLVRADRQLSVSGNLQALLDQGQFTLDGKLTIDRAAIILPSESAPTLDDDVHITSAASRQDALEQAAKQARQTAKPPRLNVQLNLGDDFALQGYGITTRLGGEITVTEGPRITGEIRTINGRYRAWGQLLDVEQGTIRFNGPYSNPSLDIIAIRPNIDIRAGVRITGSANNPRISLFSDPEMPEAEKLSWIIMGRAASGGGAETGLLQQAALAMLSGGGDSGNFATHLGLDEIGFSGPSEDGEQGPSLTIGKRLSKDLYVAYEQSLNGAMGSLYIFYDLSRRLTLRAHTGEHSAIDLIYTRTHD